MSAWKLLYAFKNSELMIVELEHLGLPEASDKSQRFQWLRIDTIAQAITPLSFIAMQDGEAQQYRKFDLGELYFTDTEAKFSPAPTIEQHLKAVELELALQQVQTLVDSWLAV
ncbi:hypothetical protein DBZ36_07615 [Alginatibacterium sediminis]|uniref:Uncharacterized protein n=1 Tax=Alginatibacterium sediminis TaxID=2164068 RepID=A0A420EI13_9ALTE|nr:hypothetical protein [Alginatibacterium sediminis]RKF20300.1 hypothetical protein DBZ36_07615 [Alginatibacterium sediminis]